ncbi:hypothetical protein WJX72_002622 [[Myrmecia] bisecta]|uniref:Tubby C-terminal domain-containing protein n=1 Tax=[Myrmecia] bisecta TaxID=41462 RepID=A0AAW1PCH9_9CHLO
MTTAAVNPLQQLPSLDPCHKRDDAANHLLEDVFQALAKDRAVRSEFRNLFAAAAVCKAWQRTAQREFFSHPWQDESRGKIWHPKQLLSLKPRAGDASRSLVKCHLRREPVPGRFGVTRFTLYLGADHKRLEGRRFLATALVTSRWETSMYLNSGCEGKPIARVVSNVLGTRYHLSPDASAASHLSMDDCPSHCESGAAVPSALGEVKYKTKIKGFMKPRRMRVSLPHMSALAPFAPQGCSERRPSHAAAPDRPVSPVIATALSAPGALTSPFAAAAQQQQAAPDGGAPAAGPLPPSPSSLMRSNSLGTLLRSASWKGFLSRASCGPASAFTADADAETSAKDPLREETFLNNKPPHWNDGLRCWCLNFRGRVKLASVKNFQLVEAGDVAHTVVMQFGKVDKDTYIMDFNPHVICALQAFAISLSTFDTKVIL